MAMPKISATAVMIAVFAIAGAALIYALRPLPVQVDTAAIESGPLEVTVDDEGVTRIREVYLVSAPLAGKVLRSPREVGDDVVGGETVVAIIQPGDPSFLDVRTRREREAVVAASVAAVTLAEAEVRRSQSELEFAQAELRRAERLSDTETISERTYEKALLDMRTREATLASTEANLELKRRELESARAHLIGPESLGEFEGYAQACCVQVRAPASGRVLRILNESEQMVAAGAPLLEVGDPGDLEIVVELLSDDAVQVSEGATAHIENWGGTGALTAFVSSIEPAGFMKVSALGIEERRVNTILALHGEPASWAALGHDFRVYVRIVTWSENDVLRVPLSALFREGEDWAVFAVEDGAANLRVVSLGHRNSRHAEILSGLGAGDRVVLHPSDRIEDGTDVEERALQ